MEGALIMTGVGYVSVRAMFLIIDCKYCLLDRTGPSHAASDSSRQRRKRAANGSLDAKQYKYTSIDVDGETVKLKLPLMTSLSGYESDDVSPDDDSDKLLIDTTHEMTYGDLGFYAFGEKGRLLVDITVIISQIGFCCAYLIFISENVSSYVPGVSPSHWLLLLLPPLFLICLLRNLAKLAGFSVFAQLSTILAFGVVFWFDFEHWHVMRKFHPREVSLDGFPFYFAIAIYCYEGAGMILSLENSLAEHLRPYFKQYFARTMVGVTLLYIVFGCSGYLSFGPFTREIITLNLPHGSGGWPLDFAMIVKLCLCVSLFLTYPLMMFPVVTVIEKRFNHTTGYSTWHGNWLRFGLVASSGLVVLLIPNFANLMAIIGGTCCTLLAFTLPGLFHLQLATRPLSSSARNFDIFLIALGVAGSVVAMWDTLHRMTADPTATNENASERAILSSLTEIVIGDATSALLTNHSEALLPLVGVTANQSAVTSIPLISTDSVMNSPAVVHLNATA